MDRLFLFSYPFSITRLNIDNDIDQRRGRDLADVHGVR